MALLTASVLTKLAQKPNKKVTVKLDGKNYDVYIKRRTVADHQNETAFARTLMIDVDGEKVVDPSRGLEADAFALSSCFVDDKGEPIFTKEQLMQSDMNSVYNVLLLAWLENQADELKGVDDTAKK